MATKIVAIRRLNMNWNAFTELCKCYAEPPKHEKICLNEENLNIYPHIVYIKWHFVQATAQTMQ